LELLDIVILQYIKMKQEKKIYRQKNNENWTKSGIDTAGWWSRWLLWNLPTIKASYENLKRKFNI
jgi:hypothetical protein